MKKLIFRTLLSRQNQKIIQLYEQSASKERVGTYLRRWLGLAMMATMTMPVYGESQYSKVGGSMNTIRVGMGTCYSEIQDYMEEAEGKLDARYNWSKAKKITMYVYLINKGERIIRRCPERDDFKELVQGMTSGFYNETKSEGFVDEFSERLNKSQGR